MERIKRAESMVEDGFYVGTVVNIEKRNYDYEVTYRLNMAEEAYAVLVLDTDLMERRTAHFLILSKGTFFNRI